MANLHTLIFNKNWYNDSNGFYFRGQAYVGQHKKPLSEVGESLRVGQYSPEELGQILSKLNGFYALVHQNSNYLLAAVDHIRSIPLFYGQARNQFFISDEAEWVRQQVGNKVMDPIAREEFQLAGYVTGADTLFPNVKQLQAGELLVVSKESDGVRVQTHRYYRFLHYEPESYNEEVLREQLDLVAINSIKRLIDYANGRQIAVPLSGGYDSRLIVTLLKRLGYDNVITFTYGIPGNKESEYSKTIAQSLGIKSYFVKYSGKQWTSEWQTEDAELFRRVAANHTSLPHMQDWLAVKELKKLKMVSDDAVFVPGHCCVTGFIPDEFGHRTQITPGSTLNEIIGKHFTGRPIELNKSLSEKILYERINNVFDDSPSLSSKSFVSRVVYFNWSERQAKYIANSVRVYEHFTYSWWLPLWDKEFADFWKEVPVTKKLRRILFKSYVAHQYEKTASFGTATKLKSRNASDLSKAYCLLKGVAYKCLSKDKVRALKIKKRERQYKNHFLCFGDLVSAEDLNRYIKEGYTIIGAYSDQYIKGTWGDIVKKD